MYGHVIVMMIIDADKGDTGNAITASKKDVTVSTKEPFANKNGIYINPYVTNGFHHDQLGESTFIFRCVRSDF